MVALINFRHVLRSMSLAHEVGHLFGCEHDDMNVVKLPKLNMDFEYGFYVDHPASHNLHTLMA